MGCVQCYRKSAEERDSFFTSGPAPAGEQKGLHVKSSIKAHFASDSLGAERQKVFDIEKEVVEKSVGEMMFNPEDDVDSEDEDEDHNDEGFGSSSKLQALQS